MSDVVLAVIVMIMATLGLYTLDELVTWWFARKGRK